MTPSNSLFHLYKSLFLSANNILAMLTIYCDDSGTDPRNPVAVVAGYLASASQWKQFTKDWLALLKEYRITQMRRADLEAFQGEFRQWDNELRKEFLSQAHLLIRANIKTAIGSAVIKEDFDACIPQETRQHFGGVYGWCIQECISSTRVWCERHRLNDPIQWVFEWGTSGHGQVQKMFDELHRNSEWKIRGWSFQDKTIVPLQAADILAYELYKQVQNRILDGEQRRPVRQSFRTLIHQDDETFLYHWDRPRLLIWLSDFESKIATKSAAS